MKISPFMDRYHPAVVENQTIFIEKAVQPLLNSLTGVLLAQNSLLHSQLEENLVAWNLTRNTHDGQLRRPSRDVVIATIAEKRAMARAPVAVKKPENEKVSEISDPKILTHSRMCSTVVDSQLETKSLIGNFGLTTFYLDFSYLRIFLKII